MSTSEYETTVGAVHWGALWVGIDGEQLSLIVPMFFQQFHKPYLDSVLSTQLPELLGDNIQFRLDYGKLSRSPTETRYEPGRITITGIRRPWPDASELRRVLEDALEEAGRIEVKQMKLADDLTAHLRAADD
jgi:hypothetical protein